MFIINHSEWGLNECDPATSLSGTLLPSGKRRTVHVSKSLYKEILPFIASGYVILGPFERKNFERKSSYVQNFLLKFISNFLFLLLISSVFFSSVICSILDMKFDDRINKQDIQSMRFT